ncbi:MAG: sigma-54-dependent transcriptional regulator [bacterium]
MVPKPISPQEILKEARVLVVDDEPFIREFLKDTMSPWQVEVLMASDGDQAIPLIDQEQLDLVITDLKMERVGGMEVLDHCLTHHPDLPVVILTAYGTVSGAVEAMKKGAFDFIEKKIEDIEQIRLVVWRGVMYHRLLTENRQLRRTLEQRVSLDQLVGPGPKMQRIFEIITTVAPTQATVLITGPSGTGKELVAQAIHYHSSRSGGPFIKVNCAALPEGLIESELFGHEKGAFTGAIKTTKGRFESASGGTLLLDEIGELPLSLQAKLLRALQDKEIVRVGSSIPINVDVRLIATTNVDLEQAVREKRFREDLFYRLNVIRIKLPPLAERREDIPVLAYHFLKRFAKLHRRKVRRFSKPAMRYLVNAPWPGNVRELENTIERAVVMSQGEEITLGDFFLDQDIPQTPSLSPPSLPSWVPTDEETTIPDLPPTSLEESSGKTLTLAELERLHILNTLKAMNGHRLKTAQALGISIRTLRNKLHEYRIEGYQV